MITKWILDFRLQDERGWTLKQTGWVSVCVRLRRSKERMKSNYHLAYSPFENRFARSSDMEAFMERFSKQLEDRDRILADIRQTVRRFASPSRALPLQSDATCPLANSK